RTNGYSDDHVLRANLHHDSPDLCGNPTYPQTPGADVLRSPKKFSRQGLNSAADFQFNGSTFRVRPDRPANPEALVRASSDAPAYLAGPFGWPCPVVCPSL